VSTTTGPVRYEEIGKFDLGNNRFLTVVKYCGKLMVHIREYGVNPNTGVVFPTRVGVTMHPQRYAKFMNMIPLINDAVEILRDGSPIDFKRHVGGGVYVTVNSEYRCVNLRKYFVPFGHHEAVPTKNGIALRMVEWDQVVQVAEQARQLSEELIAAESCFHQGQNAMMNCFECSPFPMLYNDPVVYSPPDPSFDISSIEEMVKKMKKETY
jgi:hypothetical protein